MAVSVCCTEGVDGNGLVYYWGPKIVVRDLYFYYIFYFKRLAYRFPFILLRVPFVGYLFIQLPRNRDTTLTDLIVSPQTIKYNSNLPVHYRITRYKTH